MSRTGGALSNAPNRNSRFTRVACLHSVEARERRALEDALHDLRKNQVALAGHGRVDERKLPHRFRAHDAFAIRAPEDDRDLRRARFQPARQRQRGDVLLKDRREADQPRMQREDLIRAFVEKRFDVPAAVRQPADRRRMQRGDVVDDPA
jgi:hypothetical protein